MSRPNSKPDTPSGRARKAHHTTGPVPLLNPTVRYFVAHTTHHRRVAAGQDDDAKTGAGHGGAEARLSTSTAPGVYQIWRSRDNRKGRHSVAVSPPRASAGGEGNGKQDVDEQVMRPAATNTLKETLRGVGKMLVRYPVWDISYDVAAIFTIGSVVWVINGFFVWLPSQSPQTEFPGEVAMGGGVTAFLGATVFEAGSVLLMLEAVNENRTECFGWALEEAVASRDKILLRPHDEACTHHHRNKAALFARTEKSDTGGRKWDWWPTWHELRTHYFREIGFLACLSQFVGASVFWFAGLTGLPPIYDVLSVPVANGVYWLPQVVGGTGFIISGWLFMLETQRKWYLPELKSLGWHIGFWNLIGAIGFTLCGALGFASTNETAAYASVLATFIGSWAFLIGSVVQLFESLDKFPLSVEQQPVDNMSDAESDS